MSIFTLKDGKVQVDPESLTIPEFREIYERDVSKDKSIAFNELCYVYHMADYKSIYNNYGDSEKTTKILNDYFKTSKWSPDQVIIEAVIKYRSLQETHSMKLLRAARKAVDKLVIHYDTVDLTLINAKGDLINKERDLSFSLGNIGKIAESLDKVEEKIKKEMLKDTKVRGQVEVSEYERGK